VDAAERSVAATDWRPNRVDHEDLLHYSIIER
jgi:hypothetical protein